MVDLDLLDGIQLSARPFGQRVVANLGLGVNYHITHKVEVVLEGVENIPQDHKVIFAMNHTDRYNYWPFQYKLYKKLDRFTTTWVKAKSVSYTHLTLPTKA